MAPFVRGMETENWSEAYISELRTISCRMPQGSELGTLFYLPYINDFYKSIGHESVRQYVDDTVIITNNSNLDIAQMQAREMLTKLHHWFCCK